MKLWSKILLGVVCLIGIFVIWVSLMEKEFTETSSDAYLKSSVALFEAEGISPTSNFIETDGPIKRIHYYEMGEGEPLVLIHGGGGYASQWYSILDELAQNFHLYILDRPGSGLSDNFDYKDVNLTEHSVDFVRSFMDAKGLEKAHFVGHSMGGLFTVNFAHMYPNRVDNIALIGHPAGSNVEIPPQVMLMSIKGVNKLLLKLIGPPSIEGSKDFHRMMLVHQPEKLSDIYWQNDVNAQLIPGNARAFNSLIENCVSFGGFEEQFLIQDALFDLPHKVTFIVGDKDVWDTIDNANYLVSNMNNASIHVIKDASHLPWLDAPEESASHIINALQPSE
ncbi:alpha/beta fold hydrolase [Balneola vulgaris]|uniref:alpha/beta fold hydrolase n=1 Tax=Balneola vulgaris TaxID=287535 RepID=UPI00036DC163|nr:alpha/beta hydrolase [Balneola vulgaris]